MRLCRFCLELGIKSELVEFRSAEVAEYGLPERVYYCPDCFSTFEKLYHGGVGKSLYGIMVSLKRPERVSAK